MAHKIVRVLVVSQNTGTLFSFPIKFSLLVDLCKSYICTELVRLNYLCVKYLFLQYNRFYILSISILI